MSDGEVSFLEGDGPPEALLALRDELSKVLGVPVKLTQRPLPNTGAEFILFTSDLPTRTAMAEAVKYVLAWTTIERVTFRFPDIIK